MPPQTRAVPALRRPIWTSEVRPGREHDTTAVRTHAAVLPILAEIADDLSTLGDLGYEGKADTITVALKNPSTAPSPPSSNSSTRPTTAPARSANEATPC